MGNSGAGRREEKEKTEKKPVSGSKKEKRKLEGEKRLFLFFRLLHFFLAFSFFFPLCPLSRARALTPMLKSPPEIVSGGGVAAEAAAAAAAAVAAATAAEGAAAAEAKEAADEDNCFASPVLLFRGGGGGSGGGRASTSSGSGGGGMPACMPASAAARGGGKNQVRSSSLAAAVFFFFFFSPSLQAFRPLILSLTPFCLRSRPLLPTPRAALVDLGGVSESFESSGRPLAAQKSASFRVSGFFSMVYFFWNPS